MVLTPLATATCWCHHDHVFPEGLPHTGCPSCRNPSQLCPPLLQPVPTQLDTEHLHGTEPQGLRTHLGQVGTSPGHPSGQSHATQAPMSAAEPALPICTAPPWRTFPPVGKQHHKGQPGPGSNRRHFHLFIFPQLGKLQMVNVSGFLLAVPCSCLNPKSLP